jgi:hypothetical protein
VEAWRKWCLHVADIMVETFPELSRSTLESEALFCAVSTVIYRVPTGLMGDIDTLTLHDVLYAAMVMLGADVYLKLSDRCEGLYRAFPTLYSKWSAGLVGVHIKPLDFAKALGLDENEIVYWDRCGLHISAGTKAIVEAWLQVKGPWPISVELKQFFCAIRKDG